MDPNWTKTYELEKVVNIANFPSVTFPRLWDKVDTITIEIKSLNRFYNKLKPAFKENYIKNTCLKPNCL